MIVDAVSALDECFLRLETESAHLHIGWTMFVEGTPPSEAQMQHHVAQRLEQMPRFRRRLQTSALRLHDPVWVDDERFELAEHVRRVHIPDGAPAATRQLAGELLSDRLDRRRPLWRLHVLDGPSRDRFTVVGQVHHAMVDGIAALEMAQLLLDPDPLGTAPAPVPIVHDATPGVLDRVRASASERLSLARSAGSLALRTLGRPSALAEAAGELRRVGAALAKVGAPAPATTLNRPIGPARSVAFARLSQHVARELGRRHGGTVNDMVLATATLALGRHLRRAGESHPWLRVLVPVNTRSADGDHGVANRVSAMFIELPVGERGPRAVLEEITRQTREHKRAEHAAALEPLVRASRLLPAPIRDAAAWMATRPQTFNAVVSNVPGPPEPLYLLGRRVLAVYPAVPLVQGHGLSIGVLSYCGSLHIGLYADPGVVPELVDFSRDVTSSFDALRLALEPHRSRPRPRSRTPGSPVHVPV